LKRILAVALATVLLAGGCSKSSTPTPAPAATPTTVSGTITVFAAASLTESFQVIAKDFEKENPGSVIRFNFAGSSALATQINGGAPEDVFASAAPANMKTVTDAGNADGTPVTFVKNQLVIAVPKGNPRGIKGLSDLTNPALKVALCAEQVPCGSAAKTAISSANLIIKPVTLETDVKSALSKVKLGEVDAALVYRTDANSAKADVDGIEFPESAKAINDYPIVELKGAPNATGAAAFIKYVTSDAGITVLVGVGFQKP
jgi:molybdate transport system substrate-binding protein